ncbi:hypothetical protein Anapl_08151 [Anas platyrhynchos]|uniref:Uncharacterized protein n=1 Tax=Anas platyrhynchos TaxID=8839 RepID=R0M2R8_ANAPL|nr:hypothetical protein Anapl_08151 [Anas platyrhynchos]
MSSTGVRRQRWTSNLHRNRSVKKGQQIQTVCHIQDEATVDPDDIRKMSAMPFLPALFTGNSLLRELVSAGFAPREHCSADTLVALWIVSLVVPQLVSSIVLPRGNNLGYAGFVTSEISYNVKPAANGFHRVKLAAAGSGLKALKCAFSGVPPGFLAASLLVITAHKK